MELLIQTIFDAFSLGGLYALLALGLAMVFSIMRLANIAHGELIMVGGYMIWLLSDLPLILVILVMLLVCCLMALLLERLAFRPVRGAPETTLLVTSFAVSHALQNIVNFTVGAMPKGINLAPGILEVINLFGVQVSKMSFITVIVTIILVIGLVLFLTRTTLGVQMRAAAEDFSTARLYGVKANTVIAVAFAISGLLAGVAGVLFFGQYGLVMPTVGVELVIAAFVASVVGGLGSLPGAALGGFVIGSLNVVMYAALPRDLAVYRQAFVFLVVIAFLLFRPQGLWPSRYKGRRA